MRIRTASTPVTPPSSDSAHAGASRGSGSVVLFHQIISSGRTSNPRCPPEVARQVPPLLPHDRRKIPFAGVMIRIGRSAERPSSLPTSVIPRSAEEQRQTQLRRYLCREKGQRHKIQRQNRLKHAVHMLAGQEAMSERASAR